jgi:hypothetical protein
MVSALEAVRNGNMSINQVTKSSYHNREKVAPKKRLINEQRMTFAASWHCEFITHGFGVKCYLMKTWLTAIHFLVSD